MLDPLRDEVKLVPMCDMQGDFTVVQIESSSV